MPNYRDAETGHYTTAEDAAARPAETVAARHEAPDVAELRRLYSEWQETVNPYGFRLMPSGEYYALAADAVNALPALLDAAAERDALAADADKWQRAALTLQRDRDALTDERDSLSWQAEALRAERDARSSERDALAAKVERVRALPAKHPAGGWYMTSMRDVLAALDEEPQP